MKKFIRNNIGVVGGALYALVLRLVFNIRAIDEVFSLFSVTFIWLAPIVIGLIPLFLATNDQLKKWSFRIASPVWTVVIFFILCFLTRIEDLICLWVILLPYVLGAYACGLIAGSLILKIRQRKATLLSIILIPFLASPIEQHFDSPTSTYAVSTRVIINSSPGNIWQNIIRVRQITDREFQKGFFNFAGIPRPLYAELTQDTLGATRKGHFEGGLTFIETVKSWEKEKHIGFDIKVVPSSIRQTIFDQHILRGSHFEFLYAEYTLRQINEKQAELILTSSYQLKTKINAYASFCGNQLLEDFQERLLEVIKKRCDN
ncbi:MAG: hypothetical protein ABI675_16905 [Chitinophagaceae bacterium]